MSYSLNSLRGGYVGEYIPQYYGGYSGGYEEFRLPRPQKICKLVFIALNP